MNELIERLRDELIAIRQINNNLRDTINIQQEQIIELNKELDMRTAENLILKNKIEKR